MGDGDFQSSPQALYRTLSLTMARSIALTAAALVVGAIMVTGMTRAFISALAVHATQTAPAKTLPAILSAASVTMPTMGHAAEADMPQKPPQVRYGCQPCLLQVLVLP